MTSSFTIILSGGKKSLVFRRFPLTSWVFRALAPANSQKSMKKPKGNQWGIIGPFKKAGYLWKGGWNIALGGTRPLRFPMKKQMLSPSFQHLNGIQSLLPKFAAMQGGLIQIVVTTCLILSCGLVVRIFVEPRNITTRIPSGKLT